MSGSKLLVMVILPGNSSNIWKRLISIERIELCTLGINFVNVLIGKKSLYGVRHLFNTLYKKLSLIVYNEEIICN